MPYASSNGVKLYYEESGSGNPIIFVILALVKRDPYTTSALLLKKGFIRSG